MNLYTLNFFPKVSCTVHADPTASVRWYKNTMILEETEKRRIEVFGNKNLLLLTNMKSEGK